MSKLKWKTSGGGKYARVTIGAFDLRCNVWYAEGKKTWMATAFFPGIKAMRIGTLCSSMAACKEEAFKVAREMLEDYYVAVKAEMANFDMGEEI